jgi:hypothetical protein
MARQSMGWLLGAAVGFLALIGVGHPLPPGALQSRLPEVPDHHSAARGLGRRLPGAGPLPVREADQVPAPRLSPMGREAPRSVGLVVVATALFMGLVVPFSDWPERVIIGLFGACSSSPSARASYISEPDGWACTGSG